MAHLEALRDQEGHQGCNAWPAGNETPSKAWQVRTCTACSLRGVHALLMRAVQAH